MVEEFKRIGKSTAPGARIADVAAVLRPPTRPWADHDGRDPLDKLVSEQIELLAGIAARFENEQSTRHVVSAAVLTHGARANLSEPHDDDLM
eukprot:SAG31_NODE_3499_length_4193_cov_2.250611_2_plen_92_part_00